MSYHTHHEILHKLIKSMEFSNKQIDAICHHFEKVESYEKDIKSIEDNDKNEPQKPFSSRFGKCWTEVAYPRVDLTQTMAYLPQYFQIDKKSLSILKEMKTAYEKKYQIISQRAADVSQLLLIHEQARRKTYQDYEQAGNNLRDAYHRNDPSVVELKRIFEEKQTAAIKAHENYNNKLIKTTEKIERIMTDFEIIENYRLTSLKGFFKNITLQFKQKMESVQIHSEAACDKIMAELNRNVAEPASEHRIGNKAMSCDPKYAPCSLIKAASKYMDLKEYFATELAEGGCIVRATRTYQGGYDELDIEEGELLCHISIHDSTKSVCKNINRLVGFVPNNFLSDI